MNNKLLTQMSSRFSSWKSRIIELPVYTKILFFLLGIGSTIWFLIRVIPKPSRAGYPCMRTTTPIMSSFIIYLISLGGSVLAFRKAKHNFKKANYTLASSFAVVALVATIVFFGKDVRIALANTILKAEVVTSMPEGTNNPIGQARGINPGMVVWAWDKNATDEKCTNEIGDFFWEGDNTNSTVVGEMFQSSIKKITNASTVKNAWDSLFRYHKTSRWELKNEGYLEGEKIIVKINQTGGNWNCDKTKGYAIKTAKPSTNNGMCETGPYVVLELLIQLVDSFGVKQTDIYVGDFHSHIYKHNYDIWHTKYPDINYTDWESTNFSRTKIEPTSEDLVNFSSDSMGVSSLKLFDIQKTAKYLINVANLKPHVRGGVTLTAKNYFGAQFTKPAGGNPTASHMHPGLVATSSSGGTPDREGYNRYRVLVDLMGSKYMGRNTMLFIVDGLFAGGSEETKKPVKYFMEPFNNDWCNSLFISQDEVAIESVCYDFLRAEWNGVNVHDSRNNAYSSTPNWNGVDDFIHQAADSKYWPKNLIYDPDKSGKAIPSLGIHEHWNNHKDKQYSRNMGLNKGIHLATIPEGLVKNTNGNPSAIDDIEKRISPKISNYPNPIRSKTTFQLEITESSKVSISIYDLNGQFIAKVCNQLTMDSSNPNITWEINQAQIMPGNYLCKVEISGSKGVSVGSKLIQIIK